MLSETKYKLSEITYLEKPSTQNNGLPRKAGFEGKLFLSLEGALSATLRNEL